MIAPLANRLPAALRAALLALYTGVAADVLTTYITLQRQAGAEYNPLGRALLDWGGWGALVGYEMLWCCALLACVLRFGARRPRYMPILTWCIAVVAASRWIAALCAVLTIAHVV